MKNIMKTLSLTMLVLGLAVSARAQTHPTRTTLSAAMNATATTMAVTSASGISASTNTVQRYVMVEGDLRQVTAVSGTTLTLGSSLTFATGHVSGAQVIFGESGNWSSAGSRGTFLQSIPRGSCTRGNSQVLPAFVPESGGITVDCLGGRWVAGTALDAPDTQPLIAGCNIEIGQVALASVGTNTADVANKRMVTSFYLPQTTVVTGVSVLQGGTATTDNITAGIYDSTGRPIVNTGATGTLLSGANTFKNLAISANATGAAQTTTILTGPALYFIGVTGNGSAAGAYQTVPTATFKNILSAGTTSITFGTFPSFTPPTTFTADLAPVVCLYK